jgi:Uma2 family endonuclease
MSTIERTSAPAPAPPLEAGQRLRQPEFHERYEAMPPGTRAELVGGVVVMPSPVGNRHGIIGANAITWLGVYKIRTPGAQAAVKATTILGDGGEVQPDGWLRILPAKGGQTRDVGKYVAGAPELIIEVADSSKSIDLGSKLAEYERAGALEYVVFTLDLDEVFWHERRGDRLIRVDPDPDGVYRSKAFPGLWLDPASLFADDSLAMLASLDRGLASREHAEFVALLAAR